MTRVLFCSAALIAALTVCMHFFPGAQAQPSGPVATGGAHPWVDRFGVTAAGVTDLVYTVPSDRVLVVTTFTSTDGSIFELLENGTPKLNWAVLPEALTHGNGHMTFQPGALIQYTNTGSSNSFYWYFEGYLAHP